MAQEMAEAGPEMSFAISPLSTKIPDPTVLPIPMQTRSNSVKCRAISWCSSAPPQLPSGTPANGVSVAHVIAVPTLLAGDALSFCGPPMMLSAFIFRRLEEPSEILCRGSVEHIFDVGYCNSNDVYRKRSDKKSTGRKFGKLLRIVTYYFGART